MAGLADRRVVRPDWYTGPLVILVVAAIVGWSAREFLAMHRREPIVAGPGVSRREMLSAYFTRLAGTPADTPVYILDGPEAGGTVLILGGTHPQEVAGFLAAVVLIENARVQKGRLIVIPQANASGFSHTDSLEAFPHFFEVPTPHGPRWFRNGMRLANPIHRWPDPDIFVHPASGERLVGHEIRNLNRVFPGRPAGTFVERLAYAITSLIRRESVDVVLDLHEAYPEYPVINTIVAHERALKIATIASLNMRLEGIRIRVDRSPKNLHGLSHRELGDHTRAYALLAETANPAMGRFRGRTDARLVTEGADPNYVAAARLGRLFVEFTNAGHPLHVRVARHLATVSEVIKAFGEEVPAMQVVVVGIPPYEALVKSGIGAYLRPVPPGSAKRQ
jgi:hypothetical protein